MRWYLKVNPIELDAQEAMKMLPYTKNWTDYLILPGKSGFNILRSLEEFLKDPDHDNGLYQIMDNRSQEIWERISISGNRAVFRGTMIVLSPEDNIFSFYYRDDKELNYIKNFELKDPILIKFKGST